MSEGELTIDGYQLTNCVATGNTTEIWEVADQTGGSQPLCMKLLLPHALAEAESKQVLKHEAKVGKALDHPNIVKVHKVAVTKQHGYILMDYFRAPNIKHQLTSERVGLHSRFHKVFEGICLALGYMHEKGWVHKDIKPDNILANKVGETRLIDFSLSVRGAGGLGKLLGGKSKSVQGTRTYIAPETLRKKAPTFQTDMYSLGITVYEMLTGNPPFRGMSPGELLRMHLQERAPAVSSYNPNVTKEMDLLVGRLLEKKPEKRHATMEEVFAEFRSLKVFKEDPKELDARYQAERKQAELDSLGSSDRVNSRRDHQRSEAGMNAPPKPTKPQPAAESKPQPTPPRQPSQPQQPPAGQPAAGQGYGQPGQPNAPYPNYPGPPPGYAYPPGMQPPPGYPMPQGPPGQYPPGYGPQPYPNPQQHPQQQPPQQQPPQQQPSQQQPSQQQPSQQQPSQQQPSQQPPGQQPAQQQPTQQQPSDEPSKESQKKQEHADSDSKKEEEDLPLMEMEDLPDVL